MKNKENIAFFDFCETLVNFQTADAFVDYVADRSQSIRMKKIESIRRWLYSHHIITMLTLLSFTRVSVNKKIKLFQLKGFSRSELEMYAMDYYINMIKPNIIQPVLMKMLHLQNLGYKIIIVSGGYDIYLKYFAKDYGIEHVISTRLGYNDNDCCTGRFDGIDCLYKNKVRLLNICFQKEKLYSIAFSDSSSDIPFLSWADEGYVISKDRHQKWLDNYNFKEIIW